VPVPVRRERAARLRAIAATHAAAFHQAQLGQVVSVLAERGGRGHTERFTPVRLQAPAGSLLQARVLAADAGGLWAEAA
jgi:threonylcarbamoyladenosine tRNA methylthiotransferase MtaB